MFSIMVVEDDYNTRKLMEAVLTQNGYDVILATDGIDALEKMDSHHVDLIVLDLMLPRMDGYEFTKTLRESNNNIPILMVTAKEAQEDKKRGFIVGTDDYMVKPVDEEEMLLRIAALLRRAQIVNERKLVIGETVLDYDSFTVRRGDNVQELPNKEFLLLYKLLAYQNKIFTRRSLMDELWDMNSDTDERTVDVHINRLRERFKDNPDFEIVTVRGLGYKAVVRNEKNKIS
ncbi:heme response regulator HssR [Thermoclostridium stercorarium subsp. stercorarium DSM 8532]|uniref:Heme response regulator HssR n=3 Tax=Thermoclostridium stercorarium TaxID=1510 RepID=L7VPH3_THES1|nr:response regulator transcription factor [Thermoclostridium stercorarium]AGC68667.1 heme response regulator HssR [Thermoclostridium stercorarium subsp. stercorarium DSM 8532]AGI39678.1 response regulator [Thermoclostridium stercorarium subsp. stercorarium DSM 8532]ANW99004.1 DNA-binding response regulator [Thermoclostridium stercorarium subsp. thermolacticum DSM 2910]ANX01532.1 DNA-binding response regulator [Thermoclostridium stercorarium subsp. leptospartum DSM 9219]UZQ84649.1 response reg